MKPDWKRDWKQKLELEAPGPGGADEEALRARVRADLEARGLTGDEADRLAEAIVLRLLREGPESYEAWLAGVGLAHRARAEVTGDFEKLRRELRQLERLMGGFATELSKLDEVLEVLAAYVRRMRGSSGDENDPTLH